MEEENRIRLLLNEFLHTGLIIKDLEQFLNCFSDKILGIGLGEQGIVTSISDINEIYSSQLKSEDPAEHVLEIGRVEIRIMTEDIALVCADVAIQTQSHDDEHKIIKSQFQQSLVTIREAGEWKICGLHASTPIVTEEWMEAFPLRFAEKSLRSLKEKIGEEVYLAEEQYRRAVLADTIAFYIINFSENLFEKCQLQNDICLKTEPGTPYEEFVLENCPLYVFEEDRDLFVEALSLRRIHQAFSDQSNEVSCEYRMKAPDQTYFWARTIIRLIVDVISGDRKGIMYVKNIDCERRQAEEIREKTDYDGMTKVFNKGAMMREVERMMHPERYPAEGTFLMVDVDRFKSVNDTYGHPVGDEVLIAIAQTLVDTFGTKALVGRLGGDEFGVFLPGELLNDTLKNRVEILLEKVRNLKLANAPTLNLSVSVGGAYLSEGGFEDLYRTADDALYEAKKNGKNCAAYADYTMESASS